MPSAAEATLLGQRLAMSALGQKRTSAELLDHIIGAGEQRRWHGEAEYPGGLVVEY